MLYKQAEGLFLSMRVELRCQKDPPLSLSCYLIPEAVQGVLWKSALASHEMPLEQKLEEPERKGGHIGKRREAAS